MVYIGDYVCYFGDFVYGNTAENEMIHKDTMRAYEWTNKQAD